MDIEHWRKEIDDIDSELLRLLNMRARLAIKVGVLKQPLTSHFATPTANATCFNDCKRSTVARSMNAQLAKFFDALSASPGALSPALFRDD